LYAGEAAIWHNIGKCFHERQDNEKAEEFFRKALKVKPTYANSLEGLGMTAMNRGQFGEAVDYCNRALAESDSIEAKVNRGMSYLALGRWREGWRDYNANVGKEKNRVEFVIDKEERWDGTKGLNVFCYGEQGIGDELSFASCLPDLIRDSQSVTIECDGRLEPLFKRSFQDTEVHGTRYKQEKADWKKGRQFDARVSLGTLPQFYRNRSEDFPRTPYLVPNPEMALQWRELLKTFGDKPRIGLAWTGGIFKTGQRRRSVTLDTFAPLFNGFDATWVSLQYKENEGVHRETELQEAEEKYGVKIHDWHWGNRIYDYDQTVALISELDLVISVCTAVVDAAGGLGKETWCLVPRVPMWRHMSEGSWYPWAGSVELFRQKGNEWPVHLLLGKLKDKFGNRPRNRHQQGEAALQAA
jgi:tetratricopeptide (TPR) repeat protein